MKRIATNAQQASEGDHEFRGSTQTAMDLPDTALGKLVKLTAPQLKKLITDAVKAFSLDATWAAPKTQDRGDLIDHIDELCNENSLTVDSSGQIKKASEQLARIDFKTPLKNFSNPSVAMSLQVIVETLADIKDPFKIPQHIQQAFRSVTAALPDSFTVTRGIVFSAVTPRDFVEREYSKKPFVSLTTGYGGIFFADVNPSAVSSYINKLAKDPSYRNMIVSIARVDGLPGFSFPELQGFLARNKEQILLGAEMAKQDISGYAEYIDKAAKANLPSDQGYLMVARQPFKAQQADLNAAVAFIYQNTSGFPTEYSAKQHDLLIQYLEGTKKPDGAPSTPKNELEINGFSLKELKGRHVVMIGKPPTGWSTARFAKELQPFGATVEAKFTTLTRHALYNPKLESSDKVKLAQKNGVKMLPYDDVVQLLAQV